MADLLDSGCYSLWMEVNEDFTTEWSKIDYKIYDIRYLDKVCWKCYQDIESR